MGPAGRRRQHDRGGLDARVARLADRLHRRRGPARPPRSGRSRRRRRRTAACPPLADRRRPAATSASRSGRWSVVGDVDRGARAARRGAGSAPGSSSGGPLRTRWTSRPARAPAAAVSRQWFDQRRPRRDERVGALGERRPDEELQVPQLVPAERERQEVLALDPDLDAAAERVREPRQPVERRRSVEQREARQRGDPGRHVQRGHRRIVARCYAAGTAHARRRLPLHRPQPPARRVAVAADVPRLERRGDARRLRRPARRRQRPASSALALVLDADAGSGDAVAAASSSRRARRVRRRSPSVAGPAPSRPVPRRRARRRALATSCGVGVSVLVDDGTIALDPADRRRGRPGTGDRPRGRRRERRDDRPGHGRLPQPRHAAGRRPLDRPDRRPAVDARRGRRAERRAADRRRRPLGARRRGAVRRGPGRRPAAGAEPRRPRSLGGAAGASRTSAPPARGSTSAGRCRRPRTPSRPTTPTSCWRTRSASSTTAPTS